MSNTPNTQYNKPAKTAVNAEGKPLRVGTGLPGPGRPKKADEQQARNLSIAALKKKYGSLEKAFTALLDSNEPSLKRLAYEYAFGKPTDRVDPGKPQFPQINLQLVTNNNNLTHESRSNDSIPVSPAGS